MSTLNFPYPTGYQTIYAHDFISDDFKPMNLGYFCRYSNAEVIDLKCDISEVTSCQRMFQSCSNLRAVIMPFNTSSMTGCNYMFSGCSKLLVAPALDTTNVTDMQYMFEYCPSLTEIPQYNCSNVENMSSFIGSYDYVPNLTKLGGFISLGMNKSLSGTLSILNLAPNLTKESLLNVLNGLYDRASAGYSIITFKMHANHLAMLSDEEKAIATNKGWTIA